MLTKISIFKLQFPTRGQCLLKFNKENFVLFISSTNTFLPSCTTPNCGFRWHSFKIRATRVRLLENFTIPWKQRVKDKMYT